MSLRTKFGVLIGTLAVAVALTLGLAGWSVVFLERELSTPLADTQQLMAHLGAIKWSVGAQHNLLAAHSAEAAIGPPRRPELQTVGDVRTEFNGERDKALLALEALELVEPRILAAGFTSRSNLRRRLLSAYDAAATWFDLQQPQDRRDQARDLALAELFNLHELIERIEKQSLADLDAALKHGGRSRDAVVLLTTAALAVTVLTGVLTIILVRRWILVPIARLRIAAERIGAGELDYRIDVEGADELARLSREVNQMAAALAASQKERIERERLAAIGSMTRRIVHNLRSPLAGMRMLAELTRLDLPEASPLRENQDRIVSTVDRFESWLGDLLSLTRPMELTIASRDAAAWGAEAIEPLRATAQAARCTLRIDATPTHAAFDAPRLEQALIALVTNAIEASPAHAQVTVQIGPGPEPDQWRFAVLDQGPGIPPEHRADLFRPYFTTKANGNGIGLAMAHRVVREHGGELRAEAAQGGGAAFIAEIPKNPPSPVATGGP
ncbi:MAG: ATP-binding protein [Phycisphaerales bacterium JB039]